MIGINKLAEAIEGAWAKLGRGPLASEDAIAMALDIRPEINAASVVDVKAIEAGETVATSVIELIEVLDDGDDWLALAERINDEILAFRKLAAPPGADKKADQP